MQFPFKHSIRFRMAEETGMGFATKREKQQHRPLHFPFLIPSRTFSFHGTTEGNDSESCA